jgi:hypothetical protein
LLHSEEPSTPVRKRQLERILKDNAHIGETQTWKRSIELCRHYMDEPCTSYDLFIRLHCTTFWFIMKAVVIEDQLSNRISQSRACQRALSLPDDIYVRKLDCHGHYGSTLHARARPNELCSYTA